MDADGSHVDRLTDTGALDEAAPSWSPEARASTTRLRAHRPSRRSCAQHRPTAPARSRSWATLAVSKPGSTWWVEPVWRPGKLKHPLEPLELRLSRFRLQIEESQVPGDVSTLRRVERKLATVLFVDLVDSTSLVSASDPEVVRRRVDAVLRPGLAAASRRHGGTVEKFAGDAVMAAFGVPQAHEDDAERAVRAALGILDAVQRPRARGAHRHRGRRGRDRRQATRPSQPARPSTSRRACSSSPSRARS